MNTRSELSAVYACDKKGRTLVPWFSVYKIMYTNPKKGSLFTMVSLRGSKMQILLMEKRQKMTYQSQRLVVDVNGLKTVQLKWRSVSKAP